MMQKQAALEAYKNGGTSPEIGGQQMPNQISTQTQGGLPGQNQAQTGGVISSIIPQESIRAEALRRAAITGRDPSEEEEVLQTQNARALQMNELARGRAAELVGKNPEDINRFMRWSAPLGGEQNLDTFLKKGQDIYKKNKELMDDFANLSAPQVFHHTRRQGFLTRLDRASQQLAGMGEEQYAREELAKKGLSPAEIEERFSPLKSETKSALEKLPNSGYTPSLAASFFGKAGPTYEMAMQKNPEKIAKTNENLSNFLKKNIDSRTSLLVLRDKLWRKGYDWQQIASAMDQALQGQNAAKLTVDQERELNRLHTEPPRQSLSEIFSDWPRLWQYVRGEK
jgi:hypothetical protein